MGRLAPPQNSNYLLVLRYPVNLFRLPSISRPYLVENGFAQALHSISKVGFKIHFVNSMFYAKEEKANFKLENKNQPNVCHFLTDMYIQGYEQEAIR